MLNSSATQSQQKFRLEIAPTNGNIVQYGILSGSKSYGEEKIVISNQDEEYDNGQMEGKTIKFLKDNTWRDEINEFADAIINNQPIISVTSDDAL